MEEWLSGRVHKHIGVVHSHQHRNSSQSTTQFMLHLYNRPRIERILMSGRFSVRVLSFYLSLCSDCEWARANDFSAYYPEKAKHTHTHIKNRNDTSLLTLPVSCCS